ncbi:hypothetical protein [Paraburkholderia sp. DHOC27]|uniref:hypothetical protein n=1 Tax=Paraburkholderia sp. DHOC27 TaxID=2303330 RepID=UPI000E3D9711|nr:hypothetical protein [Paraburkholderia sp. DHOC27]RFU45166.1 hypothetical protein D0B32_25870 [Paraburkholderia sp. DHOC27]
MNMPVDERLNTLSEIAHECLGIEPFAAVDTRLRAHYVVSAESLVRALESAYDIGLIAGYRLNRVHIVQTAQERRALEADADTGLYA